LALALLYRTPATAVIIAAEEIPIELTWKKCHYSLLFYLFLVIDFSLIATRIAPVVPGLTL
jgi:hypothetical protein